VKSIVAVGVLVLGLIAAKEGAPVLLLAALVSAQSGRIRRDAATLMERGRL
jgi:hypothetical protein